MVHALQAVREVLRPHGVLISITPAQFDARIDVVSGSRRMPAGRFLNPPFNRYLVAAEAALDRVVSNGLFELEGLRRRRYYVRLDRLTQLPEYIDLLGTPRPRLSPGTWPRLRSLWCSRPPGARVQVTDIFVMRALRKVS